VILRVTDKNNVDVSLASRETAVLMNDHTEHIMLTGSLRNVCQKGEFKVEAVTQQVGGSALTAVNSSPLHKIGARKIVIKALPAFARSTSNIDVETTSDDTPPKPTINLACCAAGGPWTISTDLETGVSISGITPAALACGAAGAAQEFVIKGKVTDPAASTKAFRVIATRGAGAAAERCVLGTVRAE
jgi:hypothetical protein